MNRGIQTVLLLGLALFASLARASGGPDLHPSIAALVEFETRANGAARRNHEMIEVRHFEIPLDALESDIARRMPDDVRRSLIIEKKGRKYVRWLINPEDTEFHLEIEGWLRKKRLSAKKHIYFRGYMTASRSYIIHDPVTGAQFSAKVSTNRTGGKWSDKKQGISDARQVRMAADYIREGIIERPLQSATVLDEPAMFAIQALDQAMLVRTLNGIGERLADGKRRVYLPGFSALHETIGELIAFGNGSRDAQAYWNEHYNKPLARALAEFTARFGLTYDSPHSQNFLIEMDENMKPTGRIVIRDFGDTYALANFFTAARRLDFVKNWDIANVTVGTLNMRVGLLQGGVFPSWLENHEYNQWGLDFFEEYERELSRLTGVPREHMSGGVRRNNRYFLKEYPVMNQPWRDFFKQVSETETAIQSAIRQRIADCAKLFGRL